MQQAAFAAVLLRVPHAFPHPNPPPPLLFLPQLLDLFRADRCDKISLKGLDHVIACSVADGKVYVRGYSLGMFKSGSRVPDVELAPMGPFFDLTLRRSQVCAVCCVLCAVLCFAAYLR